MNCKNSLRLSLSDMEAKQAAVDQVEMVAAVDLVAAAAVRAAVATDLVVQTHNRKATWFERSGDARRNRRIPPTSIAL